MHFNSFKKITNMKNKICLKKKIMKFFFDFSYTISLRRKSTHHLIFYTHGRRVHTRPKQNKRNTAQLCKISDISCTQF